MMRLELDAKTKILGDRYYLHHLVAQSNCSKIFLATDLIINGRKCAIKQLYPSYCPAKIRPKVESAFLDEAKILKQLAQKHPQICQFYNYFLDSGNQYIVQEWIEGTTLEARLRQRPKLKQSEIKNILVNILQILTYVHSLGIVHNDIKPGNIVLRLEDKLPVLIDFGVARKVNTDYGQNIVGTPGYMSVEQAMGKTIFNNDLYSLGLTAIYLLTGKSPQSINFNANKNNFWHREKSAFDPKLVATIDRAIASSRTAIYLSDRNAGYAAVFSKNISFDCHKSRSSKIKTDQSYFMDCVCHIRCVVMDELFSTSTR